MKLVILILTIFILCFEEAYSQKRIDNHNWAIVIHGGAGSISEANLLKNRANYEAELERIVNEGAKMLSEGSSSLDVVEKVVTLLEDSPYFNAGKGAVMNIEGVHELDASIMDGKNLKAGAVAGVKDIKNPIKAARKVMDSTEHVLLIGEGASTFAKEMKLEIVENEYFTTKERLDQWQLIRQALKKESPIGTVGCVAIDSDGNLAAATSTGGMAGKKWGRVGDVPIIGAGTYANNYTVAVSSTGHGELWIRRVVAYDISALIEYKSLELKDAANEVIYNKIDKMGGSGGGIIAIDNKSNIIMEFNTKSMFRGWYKNGQGGGVAILKDEKKILK